MHMSKSPWSAYGRTPSKTDSASAAHARDLTFGAMENVESSHEQLEKCLHRAFQEYQEIRSGGHGYQKIIADALTPSPGPETIEEQLRRLAHAAIRRRGPDTTSR